MANPVATAPTTAPPTSPPAAPPAPEGAASRPGFIPDSQFDRLDPTEQGKYARVRAGPDGGSVWQDRATLPTETVDPTKPATGDTATTPALVPEQKYQFGDLELSGQQILDLLKHKGETDLRRAAVPADPSQYKIEAKDVVLPPGMDWKFNEADPALAAARNWAHTNGLTQEQFSSLLGQYASMEAAKENTFRNTMKGELDKLGANATMRMTAIGTWLNGVVGADLAKSMVAGCFSEKQVRGLELLANKMASQGAASFRQDGREPGGHQGGRVSEEAYAAMSPSEKWDYARGFDQQQFSNNGR
jgi:capsid assembly protein